MFENDNELVSIYVTDWDVTDEKIQNSKNMFKNCNSLIGGCGTNFNFIEYSANDYYGQADSAEPNGQGLFTYFGDDKYTLQHASSDLQPWSFTMYSKTAKFTVGGNGAWYKGEDNITSEMSTSPSQFASPSLVAFGSGVVLVVVVAVLGVRVVFQ